MYPEECPKMGLYRMSVNVWDKSSLYVRTGFTNLCIYIWNHLDIYYNVNLTSICKSQPIPYLSASTDPDGTWTYFGLGLGPEKRYIYGSDTINNHPFSVESWWVSSFLGSRSPFHKFFCAEKKIRYTAGLNSSNLSRLIQIGANKIASGSLS